MNGYNFLLSGYLHTGPENGVLTKELEALTGLPARDIRRQIQRERLRGVPILSDTQNGYYLAEDDRDTNRFAGASWWCVIFPALSL